MAKRERNIEWMRETNRGRKREREREKDRNVFGWVLRLAKLVNARMLNVTISLEYKVKLNLQTKGNFLPFLNQR